MLLPVVDLTVFAAIVCLLALATFQHLAILTQVRTDLATLETTVGISEYRWIRAGVITYLGAPKSLGVPLS